VCGASCLLLCKIECTALPTWLVAERWCAVIPASDSGWTEYDCDRCAALPACCCTRSGVQHSLPDFWQSTSLVCGHPCPCLWVEPIHKRRMCCAPCPSLCKKQVCGYPYLFLWKCAFVSALVCYQSVRACSCVSALVTVRLFATNKSRSYIGAVPDQVCAVYILQHLNLRLSGFISGTSPRLFTGSDLPCTLHKYM
jgi:hypothetical protein